MTTKSYKCPSCGAGIHFKPARGKFHCDYCLSEFLEEELQNKVENNSEDTLQSVNAYHCNSCGAEVVTDETTTATFCYYCHNPVIISSRLSGEFKPNKLIPFSVDKEKAKQIFLSWAQNKRFIPRDFTSNSQLEKITGVYLPYWWADCTADVHYVGEGRNIRVWRSMGREYTETKKYEILREGQINLNNVEEVAFSKIDKNLLNGIAPYNTSQVKAFSMPYLSGFFAEQYDIAKDRVFPMMKNQVDRYSKSLIKESVNGYQHVHNIRNNVDVSIREWHYTLLPAWILTYRYRGKTYVYAVNGQTGKSFGELPLSRSRVLTTFGVISGITSIALLLGGRFIW
ncbi:zinc ribbon domain-containing protein [Alkaliphilus oremlandii]|uniref:Uncharacterized protein n=1 Tax=Alkaliphilus oremlandii (strain OhILAs) TaxID=350688 RepID=A8ML80_ALKOO|nr:zinc ribbon domain-containing protein [Alkaliphilus oremlandii]ABW17897.1 conserved hypothetical protein [Alkaliphilus oremlandii OhILAs]